MAQAEDTPAAGAAEERPRSGLRSTAVDCVAAAVAQLAAGRPVLVLDDGRSPGAVAPGETSRNTRSETGYLLVAGAAVSTAAMAFVVRHSSGYIEVAMPESWCDRLRIAPMWWAAPTDDGAIPAVAVDLARSDGTGISASDRAATIRKLADPSAMYTDFVRPGHVLPLRVRISESAATVPVIACLLAEAATGRPVAAVAAVPSEVSPANLAAEAELHAFGNEHAIPMLTPIDVISARAVMRVSE